MLWRRERADWPGTSAGFWLGGQCPLAALSEEYFENLTTKWCTLKYIWIICRQHSAVLYTCLPWLLWKYNINIENCSFCMFSLFNFSFIFSRGSADPIWPYVRTPIWLTGWLSFNNTLTKRTQCRSKVVSAIDATVATTSANQQQQQQQQIARIFHPASFARRTAQLLDANTQPSLWDYNMAKPLYFWMFGRHQVLPANRFSDH